MNNPLGIIFGALLFGVLRAGGNMMQMTARVPSAVIYIIQGLVIVFVVTGQMITFGRKAGIRVLLRSARAAATGVGPTEPEAEATHE
jgi:ABC-type uncharacterized transport system permease subunit